MSPDTFWQLTPWQFKCCVRGYYSRRREDYNEAMTVNYISALIARSSGKAPDLKTLLIPENEPENTNGKKPSRSIDENAIMARFRAYSAEYKKVNKVKPKEATNG